MSSRLLGLKNLGRMRGVHTEKEGKGGTGD